MACVSLRAALASGLVTAGLVLLAVWLFEFSLERAAVLAPVLVVVFAKVGWESLQRRRRPWLVVGVSLAAIVLLVVLSRLGVELPREG
jgi:hypothetical protein